MKKRLLRILTIFLLIISCSANVSTDMVLVYADARDVKEAKEKKKKAAEASYSSMHNTNSEIYKNRETEKESKPKENEDVSWAEETFSSLIRGLGTGLEKVLENDNVSLDRILYGRVKTGPNEINWFTFELENGNPYGVTGAFMFQQMKRISLLFIVIAAFSMFVPVAWGMGKERAFIKLKERAGNFLLAYVMIFLAPYVVALFVGLRDIVLFLITKANTSEDFLRELSDNGLVDLVNAYYENSKESKRLLDAALYLSVVVISVWLAMVYVFTAIGAMINFMFFPFVALFSYRDSSLIKNWIKTMAADIATPVIDSILFLLPLIMTEFGAPGIVVFATSMAVIPSRSIVRNTLGIQQGSRMGDMLGLGAVMAAGKMVGGTMRTLGNVKNSVSDIKNDFSMGKMYDGMSKDVGTLNSLKAKSMGTGGLSSNGEPSSLTKGTPSRMDQNEMIRSKNALESGSGDAESKYLASQANVNNFENPMIRGSLSNQDMAKFYRQRARRAAGKLTASVAGNVAGGGIGLASSMFGSPATKMMATSIGSTIGGEVAPVVASAAVKGIKEGHDFFTDSTGYIQNKSNAIGQAARNLASDYKGTSVENETGLNDLDSIEPEIYDNASKFNESDDVRKQIAGINTSSQSEENKYASIKNVRASAYVESVNRQLTSQGKPKLSELASQAVYAGAYEQMGTDGRDKLDGALVKANISSVASKMHDSIAKVPQHHDVEPGTSQETASVDVTIPESPAGTIEVPTTSEPVPSSTPSASAVTDIQVDIDEGNQAAAASVNASSAPVPNITAADFFHTRKSSFSQGIPQEVLQSVQGKIQEELSKGLQQDTPQYSQTVAMTISQAEATWLNSDVRNKNLEVEEKDLLSATKTYIRQRSTELNKKFTNQNQFEHTLNTYGLK